MRKTATRLLGVMLLMALAGTAQAVQYPNGTFPDTVAIWNIQHPLAVPHPVRVSATAKDTVFSVKGIVTGFDAIPTGFGFYMQSTTLSDANGPLRGWGGIDCFTGSTNYQCKGLQVGDSVSVSGAIQEFPTSNGETEIEGLDFAQATDDITVNILSHNNPLPPFHIGPTSELKQVPHAAPAGADSVREKWEGSLVQLNGPLRVARNSTTGGLGQNNAYIVVDNTICPTGSGGPCDSVFIDTNTLTTLSPPIVGSAINQVRGIYNERALGYRIQPRSGDDVGDSAPPSVVDAWPITQTKVRVTFDRSVTPGSATNTVNYSLGSSGSIVVVAVVDPFTVDVTINNGLSPGDDESITVNGLVRASNSAVQTTPATRNFKNGLVTIAQIQAPSPDSLARVAGCRDVSQYIFTGNGAGPPPVRLTFEGVCTGNQGALYYVQQVAGGQRTAVAAFAPICALVRNHKYIISGGLQEFPVVANNGAETEVVGINYVQETGVGTVYPDIQTVGVLRDTTCDATQSIVTGEDYEIGIVKVFNVMVAQKHRPGQTFRIAGPYPTFTDTISVDSTGTWTFASADSGHIVSVTGSERLNFGQWRIAPRDVNDLIDHGFSPVGVPSSAPSKLTFAVFPNPSRTANFAFGLPRGDDIELGVYDLQGRQVASVLRGHLSPGNYTHQWDGMASNGKPAQAGMYFYRLRVGTEVRSVRGIHLN